jgi:Zn-dependent protease
MYDFTFVQKIFILAIPLIYAITVHEVAHGWIANKLGDSTAKHMGRLTLNPIKHIDLLGTLIIPGLLLMTSNLLFGWAKPVPINPRQFHKPRQDMAIVALAGPFANLTMALCWTALLKVMLIISVNNNDIGTSHNRFTEILTDMSYVGIRINLMLMLLNSIPISPLDGSHVLASLLPQRFAYRYDQTRHIGLAVLLCLSISGVLPWILNTPVKYLVELLFELFDIYSIQRII